MLLTCIRCDNEFENAIFRGYCDRCCSILVDEREERHDSKAAVEEAIGAVCVTADWSRKEHEYPQTAFDESTNREVCGLCGCDELKWGYGFAGGFGLGSYRFCGGCYAVLNFQEDTGE